MASVLNLNNEVVKMRKDVKKVKVLAIRRLTRNISKLKSKKGTEELIQKNQRRAQRMLEEIHTIKKLRPDDVTKTALLKEINFEKVCKKPNTTLEFRAIARLATHPLLKQKISAIKDAIKAFKEARKNGAEPGNKMEETCEHEKPEQIVRKVPEKQYKSKETMQNQKAEDINPRDESMDNPPCETLHKETDLVASSQRHEEIILDSQNGQKPALLSKAKVAAKRKVVQCAPKKPASLTVPKVSAKRKLVEGVPENSEPLIVPKESTEDKLTEGVPEKPESLAVPKVSPERTPIVGTPEKRALENKVDSKSGLSTKTAVHESGSDSSDIEDSDKEDKEYFDDSTEERFYKQSSGFEDSDSDSEDDFFLGKVRRTKKKKSSKNPSEDKVEKEKLPTESRKSSAGGTEAQKGNAAPKTVKLESVFCSSLSHTKQKSSFMKRETKLPPVRNKRAVVPQAPKFVKKPPAARNNVVKSQSKPEPALHPSWEASRKRKEQSQTAVFQGKKIVFDD